MRTTKAFSLAVTCSIFVVAAAFCVRWIGRTPVSRFYNVKTHYGQMPTDDTALENWLKSQAGVVAHTVHTRRDGNELHVSSIMSQTLSAGPPVPDFSNAC